MPMGRRRWWSRLKQRERDLAFPPPFCSLQALSGWAAAHQLVVAQRSAFLDSNANLFRKHPRSPAQK